MSIEKGVESIKPGKHKICVVNFVLIIVYLYIFSVLLYSIVSKVYLAQIPLFEKNKTIPLYYTGYLRCGVQIYFGLMAYSYLQLYCTNPWSSSIAILSGYAFFVEVSLYQPIRILIKRQFFYFISNISCRLAEMN